MIAHRIAGRARRAWTILRQQGGRALGQSLIETARDRLGRPSAARRAYLAHIAAEDARFDTDFGVDTGGVQHLYDLTIASDNAAFGINHIASDPGDFAQAIDALDIEPAGATFVDFGAGKARALMLACAWPFRAIIGVEFARELHAAGLENLARAAGRLQAPERVSLHLGDATSFAIPDGPLILYFFNPFDEPVMAAVADNVTAALRGSPRPVRIAYMNPVQAHVWTNLGWTVVTRQRSYAIIAPPG